MNATSDIPCRRHLKLAPAARVESLNDRQIELRSLTEAGGAPPIPEASCCSQWLLPLLSLSVTLFLSAPGSVSVLPRLPVGLLADR